MYRCDVLRTGRSWCVADRRTVTVVRTRWRWRSTVKSITCWFDVAATASSRSAQIDPINTYVSLTNFSPSAQYRSRNGLRRKPDWVGGFPFVLHLATKCIQFLKYVRYWKQCCYQICRTVPVPRNLFLSPPVFRGLCEFPARTRGSAPGSPLDPAMGLASRPLIRPHLSKF